MIFLHELKQASIKKETNHELTKDDEGMIVLTQKGENENLTKNFFRVKEGNKRLFTLIKPQGNDRDRYPQILWPVSRSNLQFAKHFGSVRMNFCIFSKNCKSLKSDTS